MWLICMSKTVKEEDMYKTRKYEFFLTQEEVEKIFKLVEGKTKLIGGEVEYENKSND